MKKLILTFLILLLVKTTYSQTKDPISKLNLDFELTEKGNPKDWSNFGATNYSISLDSTTTKSGKYSTSIKLSEGSIDYKALSFTIPNSYSGKKIKLSGYIKTENVTDGFAGLWMRIDPNIAFDNMEENGIKGTTDWKKYEITLEMNPEKTKQIVFGGLLAGKGKVWFDNFKITIDGKDIQNLKPFQRKIFPAENDKEFAKGSQITSISVEKTQIENLKTLGLIWGFLKYYHPNVAKGQYNWDYELFRIIPKIVNLENSENRDEILLKWIGSLGEIPSGEPLKTKPLETKILPDLDWIKNSNFSAELTNLLLKIQNTNRTKEHYYIELQAGVGNPDFKNEDNYSSMKYPDVGFRILSLYRYWNAIQYYFPYKNLIEEDWKNVLEEFIPKMINANDETNYKLTTLELIGRIHDTHANIWNKSEALENYFGLRFAALEVEFIENKLVVTDFYKNNSDTESGLEIGDVILSINNKPVEEIVKDKLKHTPASNYPTKLRDIATNILRTNDSIININYIRNNKVANKSLKTFSRNEVDITVKYQVTDTCFKMINKDIAYLNNGSLKSVDLPKIWKEIEKTKGLIIDIRNYPSDFTLYTLSKYLMPKKAPYVTFTTGSIENPGLFTYGETYFAGGKNKNYYKGKVVIIVNETTQSSAEFHSMAYRLHPNSTVIGSTTAGADGNVSQFSLPGGISTMISGIGVYYPNGKETQRIGIVPDIEVKPTIQGIRNGEDEVMKKAIDIINGQ